MGGKTGSTGWAQKPVQQDGRKNRFNRIGAKPVQQDMCRRWFLYASVLETGLSAFL